MIFYVIPAYNEELNIARLISETDAFSKKIGENYQLIIADDGSRDRTADIVRQKSEGLPLVLISYLPNRGVQEAFRRGFQMALGKALDGDVIVTMEADGTADWEILPVFLRKIREGLDVVVASYYARGGSVRGTAWHRKVLSRCGNIFTRIFLPIKGVSTYSSFYRIYRPAALKAVLERYGDFYEEKGFACVVELLYRIHCLGFRVGEVPMVLEGARRVGKSKMKVFQTILGYLRIGGRAKLKKN